MKTSILIICTALITLGALAFRSSTSEIRPSASTETPCNSTLKINYLRYNQFRDLVGPPVFYKVDSRFLATVTQEKLHAASSIREILPATSHTEIEEFLGVTVTVFREGVEIRESGQGEFLTPAQIHLLQSTNYSNTIRIEANYKNKDKVGMQTGFVYYISITPAQKAEYAGGYTALIDYLKNNSEDKILSLNQDQLRAGKVVFTVGKTGTIAQARLEESSGFAALDKAMLELIKKIPGNWKPAKNASGEAVEQDLVFFFGREGC